MADKISGTAIENGTITVSQMASNTWAQVYGALAIANAAYDKANTVITPGTNVAGDLIFSTGRLGLGISPNTRLHVEGTTTLGEVIEKINVSATAMSANLNFDVLTQPILYLTSSATANSTFYFRGNSTVALDGLLRSGQTITVSLLVTNGGTPYKANVALVDNIVQTIRWAGGTEPVTGSAGAIDLYSFTIIKTANAAFTVLASQQRYG